MGGGGGKVGNGGWESMGGDEHSLLAEIMHKSYPQDALLAAIPSSNDSTVLATLCPDKKNLEAEVGGGHYR